MLFRSMTYRHDGKQVIVVAISTRGKPAEFIALALGDGTDDASVAAPSPMPLGASVAAAARINATPAELATGRDAYARTCTACHGPAGVGLPGGAAPSLAGRDDPAQIARTISQGSGEMPGMGAVLRPDEIDAIAKFVASGFPRVAPGAGAGQNR